MTLTPAFLDELRARTTLSALIGRTTKLTRAGREWKACCPFHNEKSPSFTWVALSYWAKPPSARPSTSLGTNGGGNDLTTPAPFSPSNVEGQAPPHPFVPSEVEGQARSTTP